MRMLPPRSGSRLAVLFSLGLAVLFLPGVVVAALLPALSPFLLFGVLLSTHVASVSALCAVPVLALVLWRRRGFCHYGCPVGWLVEICAKLRPSAEASYRRVPQVGQWLALLTFGGALAGCPLFVFLDPVGMFAAAAGVARLPLSLLSLGYAACLALVVLLSVLFPLVWCKKLCPLGATQDLAAELKAMAARRVRREEAPTSPQAGNLELARRAFLGVSGGMGVSLLVVQGPRETEASPLRPPGATDEAAMRALCIRCGTCVRVCPTRIIEPDVKPSNVTGLLVPTIRFNKDGCLDTCNACGRGCPTGAIAALSLEEKNERKIGLAVVEQAACLLTVEKECSVCSIVCKRGAVVEEFSKETYTTAIRIDEVKCNGCGACVGVCPVSAIVVRRA